MPSVQQFPLTIRLMGALQRADRFCSDEFIALAMDEELQKRDASVMRPATDSQRELLGQTNGVSKEVY